MHTDVKVKQLGVKGLHEMSKILDRLWHPEPFHWTTVKRALETRLAEYRQECTESTKDDTTWLEKKPILFSPTLTMMPKEKRLAR